MLDAESLGSCEWAVQPSDFLHSGKLRPLGATVGKAVHCALQAVPSWDSTKELFL